MQVAEVFVDFKREAGKVSKGPTFNFKKFSMRERGCVYACESVSSMQLSTKVLTLRRLCFRAEP